MRAPSNSRDWASVQAAAAESRRQVRMVVDEATLIEFKDGCVNLKVAPDLMTAASAMQEEIRQLVGRTWGRAVRVQFAHAVSPAPVAASSGSAQTAGDAAGESGGLEAQNVAAQGPNLTVANATDNPLIAKAVELFGAKVLGVYPRQK
ncbi:MAG: hypothetical protein JNK16_07990 [Phycisphaerales bacterium]|nr:hypothetical protein [Phycisphaerales bacterium]